jgi:hypothetical protein
MYLLSAKMKPLLPVLWQGMARAKLILAKEVSKKG